MVLDLRKHYFTKELKHPVKVGNIYIYIFKLRSSKAPRLEWCHCDRAHLGGAGGDKDQEFSFRQKRKGSWAVVGLMVRKCAHAHLHTHTQMCVGLMIRNHRLLVR